MWDTSSLWFDLFVYASFLLLGHILLGHFEERSPRIRKLGKALGTIALFLGISIFFGRIVAFSSLGVAILAVVYIHGVLLPRKGINGWTAKPLDKYYEYRGWDKDIFKADKG